MERLRGWGLALMVAGTFPLPMAAQDGAELALVKALFAELQPLSIQKNREYCGYIGYDAEGALIASKAKRGSKDGCTPRDPREIEVVISSYHTHGSYLPDYASETPSVDDMEADEAEGIDGWVATPGGRIWYIDTEEMETWQVCGEGCVPMDATFDAVEAGEIAARYRYDDLVTYFEE